MPAPGTAGRFNFNCLLHLSLLGTICYLVAGFGWPRTVDIDPGKFKHPRAYTVITRLIGPLANLLLAGIAGSLVMIMNQLEWDPRVFLMLIGVNITTAIYNLIILPPLAGGHLGQRIAAAGIRHPQDTGFSRWGHSSSWPWRCWSASVPRGSSVPISIP